MLVDGTPRIMIVESYPEVAKSIVGSLAAFPVPLRISVVPDAQTALQALELQSFDLVISDTFFLQGEMSGLDLCRVLKSLPMTQDVPVILLLGGFSHLERFGGMLEGADSLLHKPIQKEELLNAVTEGLLRNVPTPTGYPVQEGASAAV